MPGSQKEISNRRRQNYDQDSLQRSQKNDDERRQDDERQLNINIEQQPDTNHEKDSLIIGRKNEEMYQNNRERCRYNENRDKNMRERDSSHRVLSQYNDQNDPKLCKNNNEPRNELNGNNHRQNHNEPHYNSQGLKNDGKYEKSSQINKEQDGTKENHNNWYTQESANRLMRICKAGIQRNNDAKKYYESSKQYDNLKRAFYNVTEAAHIEGDITLTEKHDNLGKIRRMDKKYLDQLHDMKRDYVPRRDYKK